MSADDDGLDPSRNGFGDSGENNGFTEDCTTKDIPDLLAHTKCVSALQDIGEYRAKRKSTHSTIRTLPHLLQMELLHPGFIRGNSRTFDTYFVLDDGIRCIDCNLVIGLTHNVCEYTLSVKQQKQQPAHTSSRYSNPRS